MSPAEKQKSPATKFAVLLLAMLLGAAGMTLLFSAVWGREGLLATRQQNEQIVRMQRELKEARKQNRLLAERITRLADDVESQKDEIRRILGLIGPDEVILVPDANP